MSLARTPLTESGSSHESPGQPARPGLPRCHRAQSRQYIRPTPALASLANRKPIPDPARPLTRAEPTQRTAAEANSDVSLNPRMTEKKTGVRKIPNSVTPTMPLNTAIPSDRRISEPAPEATASGITPMMKANEVIRIGRSLSWHASSVAS